MESYAWIIAAASVIILVLLVKFWLRLHRHHRAERSDLGKSTVHEISLKTKRPPQSSRAE